MTMIALWARIPHIMHLESLRAAAWAVLPFVAPLAFAVEADLSDYHRECGIGVRQDGAHLEVSWSAAPGAPCVATFSLKASTPLIESLRMSGRTLLQDVQPVFPLTTGARVPRPGVKYIFFDKPGDGKNGPVRHFTSTLELQDVRVASAGQRLSVSFKQFSAGPFSGELNFHFYADSPLMQVEAAMSLAETDVAYIYDAVLDGEFATIAWRDLHDQFVRLAPTGEPQPVAVRNRTILAESPQGTVGIFAPPHAFFFPRDYSVNYKFAQVGRERFGLRQDPLGGPGHEGTFIPWFDAPAGKTQHMSMFVFLSTDRADQALEQIKRYTHGDAYKPLAGHITLATHMHSALTVNEQTAHPRAATFKKVFKQMNVNAFQLAEFHGDGHPNDPGALRLNELKSMFDLCRNYSDDQFLLIPSEEANAYFPGHTVLLFPAPVYLTLTPIKGAPFSEDIAPFGKVYHPQSADQLAQVLREEHGLGWTSHPRIKGSEGCPDKYKDTAWYKAPLWLGGTWKAMPGDLSEPRLGVRCLDLLDDMNLWGQRKMIPAEVDCFTIDETHEIYGPMNINYVRVANLPAANNWTPILDALRAGDFFVTTGEVLIHSCHLRDGKVLADIEWTLPLGQAELVTCDGTSVQRKTIALPQTREFGRQTFEWPVDFTHLQWFRLEVWDVAYDGAFTMPSYAQ